MENKEVKRFNLRVYGLLIVNNKVLVTDEHRGGVQMTKFPGGGLEKGEGLMDGLIREFEEELEIAVNVTDFYYVNEFLQISAFNPADQLLSFYYRVETTQTDRIPAIETQRELVPNEQTFRWVDLAEIHPDLFTFPIDKVVAEKLKA